MFYDTFVTAIAVALALTVWFVIGHALSKAGLLKWISNLTIVNPPMWMRVILYITILLFVMWPCALYVIVNNAYKRIGFNLDN